MILWPTPTANDWKNAGYQQKAGNLFLTLPGAAGAAPSSPGESIPTRGGRLNPTWVAWLMGFPLDWLEID